MERKWIDRDRELTIFAGVMSGVIGLFFLLNAAQIAKELTDKSDKLVTRAINYPGATVELARQVVAPEMMVFGILAVAGIMGSIYLLNNSRKNFNFI